MERLDEFCVSYQKDYKDHKYRALSLVIQALASAEQVGTSLSMEVYRHTDQISGACGECAELVDEGIASITFTFGKGVLKRR